LPPTGPAESHQFGHLTQGFEECASTESSARRVEQDSVRVHGHNHGDAVRGHRVGSAVRDPRFDPQCNRRLLRGQYSRDRNAPFRLTLVKLEGVRTLRPSRACSRGRLCLQGWAGRDSRFLKEYELHSETEGPAQAILGIPGAEARKARESSFHPRHPA